MTRDEVRQWALANGWVHLYGYVLGDVDKAIADVYTFAKTSGKDQRLEYWMEDCDGSATECSFDSCNRMVRPDGSEYIVRVHLH